MLNPMRSMFDTEDLLPEVGIQQSGKRFKLYEKKKLNHEKAKKFCKKKEGSLAQGNNNNNKSFGFHQTNA